MKFYLVVSFLSLKHDKMKIDYITGLKILYLVRLYMNEYL